MHTAITPRPNALMRGFTLIELMIVVAIIALISSIGYPSYIGYMAKSHRQAAKNISYQIADRQEQFFLDNRAYAQTLSELGFSANIMALDQDGQLSGAADATAMYWFTLTNATPTTYTLTLAPVGVQAKRDVKCGNLTLTNTGERDSSGVGTDCW